jgi:large subunit ribosomal protein L10
MPNLINREVSREYESVFTDELDTLFLQPVGLSVEDVNAFRGKLAEAGLRLTLVKGSLARRAMEASGLTDVSSFFEGPAAVVQVEEGAEVEGVAITAARVVEAWAKETGNELPAVKGGVMDGEILGGSAAASLAKLPTKADLQARLVAQILSPAASISGQLIAGGGQIAGAIKTRIENLEGEG